MDTLEIALPKRAFALCFTQRSGSNHLAREMRRTGCLGSPKEYFEYEKKMFGYLRRYDAKNLRHYVSALAAATATPNGVFGTKLHSSEWLWLQRSSLRNWLNGLPAVLTFRRDIVAQAVSYHIAAQTGAWHSELAPATEPQYKFEDIFTALKAFEENNRFWTAWILQRKTPVMVLAYEDFAYDPAPFVARIARFLDVAIDPAYANTDLKPLSKQATGRNTEWEARFRNDLSERGLSPVTPMLKPSYPGGQ